MKVRITDDKLKAYVTVGTDEKFPSKVELMDALWKAGVVYGIKEDVIKKILSEKRPVGDVLIAEGKAPVPGEDAKLIWYIDISTRPVVNDGEIVDLRKLKLFEYVTKGQELVSKLPGTKGTPGKAVTGEDIIIPGRDVQLPGGKNTTISADGLTLYADVSGYAYLKDGRVCVDDIIVVRNVDYSSGNIKFSGSVKVEEDVRPGFMVEAEGTVDIGGNVEAAFITSREGDVIVKLGVVGRGKARIVAGKGVRCGYIQDARIKAKGDVVVDRYIINSSVVCGGNVIVGTKGGIIRGGKVFSQESIVADEIGGEQGVLTEVGISSPEFYEAEAKRSRYIKQEEELRGKISLLKKKIAFLELLKKRAPSISEAKIKELKESLDKLKELEVELRRLVEKEKEDVGIDKEKASAKCIIVKGFLHRNVILTFGNYQHITTKKYEGVKVYRVGDEIIFEKLNKEEGKADGEGES